MKSSWYIFLLISISLVFTSFIEKPVQDPYFVKMKGFKVLAFNTQRIELFSTAVFYNTYKYKAKLVEIDIDVYLENKLLGKVVNQENIPIPKLSAFDIPLLLKLEPPGPAITNSLWQSAKLLTGQKVKIRYVGFIKLKIAGIIPIKVPIEDEMLYSLY